jgi:hypothetical protein
VRSRGKVRIIEWKEIRNIHGLPLRCGGKRATTAKFASVYNRVGPADSSIADFKPAKLSRKKASATDRWTLAGVRRRASDLGPANG